MWHHYYYVDSDHEVRCFVDGSSRIGDTHTSLESGDVTVYTATKIVERCYTIASYYDNKNHNYIDDIFVVVVVVVVLVVMTTQRVRVTRMPLSWTVDVIWM